MALDRQPRTGHPAIFESPHDRLRDRVVATIEPSLLASGMSPGDVRCTIEDEWPGLTIRITLPVTVKATAERALAVRALDAVRSADRTFGDIDVIVATGAAMRPPPDSE